MRSWGLQGQQYFTFYHIKQIEIDSTLLLVCSVTDHRGHQNVVRTSVNYLLTITICETHFLNSKVWYSTLFILQRHPLMWMIKDWKLEFCFNTEELEGKEKFTNHFASPFSQKPMPVVVSIKWRRNLM